ncbi:MAG: TadE/TadG family type IV pilus assembly protein [Candidatus Limnocylindrales bacterium]
MRARERQRGQGLVEFALIVPLVLLLVVSVAELGLAFGNKHTVGYGSREGARVGAALANGGVPSCSGGADPAGVDAAIVAAVQRILKSPGSGIDVSNVQEIRIFLATASGDETPGVVNVWAYAGEQAGPDVDPGPGATKLDFLPQSALNWPACGRDNASDPPDSVGVTVTYRYDFITPLPDMLEAISGGALSLGLTETTVMALNPSL